MQYVETHRKRERLCHLNTLNPITLKGIPQNCLLSQVKCQCLSSKEGVTLTERVNCQNKANLTLNFSQFQLTSNRQEDSN